MKTDLPRCGRRPSGRPRSRRAGQTISWLAFVSSGLFVAVHLVYAPAVEAEAKLPEHRYVGVRKCAGCHKKKTLGNQRAVWQRGPHFSALKTLESPASISLAKKLGISGSPAQAPECLRCHVTAFGLPEESFAYELVREDGVQCESCHGPGRDYRKKKIMSDRKLAAKKGLWDSEDPAICTSCHNSESPTFDPKRFRRPDGTTTAFDFDLAVAQIQHPIPEEVKGHYLEIEARLKAEGKKPE